jgi:DNA-binding GntR family transcriptional regulator
MVKYGEVTNMKALSTGALRHQIVRHLLFSIFKGELASGTQLRVMKLAEQFGLSSTPVREALVELESIGMIGFVHNRGAIVNPFGLDEFQEIYHLRRLFEVESTRCACGRIDAEEMQSQRKDMSQLLKSKSVAKWAERVMQADRRFHASIAAACGNKRLAQEIHRYDTLIQSLRDVVGHLTYRQQEALTDHIAIIDALLAGDAEKAAAFMNTHIEHAAASVSEALFPSKK